MPDVHVVWLAPAGFGQAVQSEPHEFVLVLSTQTPLQLCVAVAQGPHAALAATHTPLQSWGSALGQVPPHFVPSHVAVPPVIAGHAEHDDEPHEPTSILLTHFVPHRW